MAKTITSPVTIVNNMNQLNKWSVIDYQDRSQAAVPSVYVQIQIGKNSLVYGVYTMIAYDSQESLCLFVNPASVSLTDQLSMGWRSLTQAYTTLTDAYDGASGNKKARLQAIENAVMSVGLIDTALAGT